MKWLIFVLMILPFFGIDKMDNTIELDISFPFKIEERNGYSFIEMENAYYTFDKIMLPYKIKVLKFPIGTKILGVEITAKQMQNISIDKIMPAPPCLRDDNAKCRNSNCNILSYNIGVGIDGKNRVIFLSIQIFPFIYTENKLKYISSANIKIKYSFKKPLFKDDYDLLIICPSQWKDDLMKLKQHKESHGIRTLIATLDEIKNKGRDEAEKIKYFIKDCIEKYGIKYVLLVGGRKFTIKEKWYMPVRYSHLDDGGEKRFLSDLYFADIYKYEDGKIKFEDWDSNGNGIYGEWRAFSKDILDLYPDVYVGRLPCRNKMEVRIVVNKIIEYENSFLNKEWFKRFVGIAGDTYPNKNDPYFEGELATAESYKYLKNKNFEAVFLWASKNLTTSKIINEINKGCGFLHFSGHGNPMSWATHPPYDEETWIGIDVSKFLFLSNKGKYPICIVGGCHNNQFNVSILNLLKIRHLKEIYYKCEWSPECWGWWLVRKINGGTIATIANTGYGYGIPGENCLKGRGRFMEINFFKSYAEGKEMLGEVHAQNLIYYLNAFPPMTNLIDTKIVEEWELLGDPSLKIGGYG